MKMLNRIFLAVIICYLLSGCGTDQVNFPKSGNWKHVTEKPYFDRGRLYVPQLHYKYNEVGYASWYGSGFHGSKTALGNTYNMYAMTAAHRTLPLPSVVRVTNLDNGKSVILVVNDRGPFVKTDKRIIDVSKKAAEILGFAYKGSARVRVTCLERETILLTKKIGRNNYGNYPTVQYAKKNINSNKPKVLLAYNKTEDSIGNFIKKIKYMKDIVFN